MNKLVLVFILGLSGVAIAQPGPAAGSAAAGSATAGSGAAAQPAPPPEPTPAPAPVAGDAHKVCVDALNADPELAKRVVATYNKKAVEAIDQQTIDAHKRASADIAENERHVIWAYAAMWILSALFLVYMWRRQQGLKSELAQLRRELDAAAKESK